MKIIESIPNISEGRNKKVIEACVDQIRETIGCTLMQYTSDPSHNRSVITYMGSPEAVEEASIKLAKKAVELIDLTKHKGEHPRIGCVDVMPFVPLQDVTEEECINLTQVIGKRISKEANLPVFLYEKSAKQEYRKNLADIRRGGFEGLNEKMKNPKWIPDFGGSRINSTGGAVCVGCRLPLIAWNVNLDTNDLDAAKNIAKEIRESSGGMPCVKALGIMLKNENIAQVSINLSDYRVTPPHKVTEEIRKLAKKRGIKIKNCELIGLCPAPALYAAAGYYLQIEDFDEKGQVIENYLLK